MAAEQQLERSVLERKEREELRTIAQAMALDTNSRTKKADIIEQILHAAEPATHSNGTGSPPGAAEVKTPRPRATRRPVAQSNEVVQVPVGEHSVARTIDSHGTDSGDSNGVSAKPLVSSVAADSSPGTAMSGSENSARRTPVRSGDGGTRDGSSNSDQPGSTGVPTSASDSSASVPASSSVTSSTASTGSSTPPVQAPSQGQGNQPGRQGQGQSSGDGQGNPNDPANRRGRRRRGRDRPDRGVSDRPGGSSTNNSGAGRGNTNNSSSRGGERELQGGGQDSQYQGELVPVRGLLELRDEGYGFVRADGYLPSPRDVYVSISQARRFALRKGDFVEGACRPAASNEKFPALLRIDTVSGLTPDEARVRPRFEDLTPLFPDEKLRLESPGGSDNVTARIIDLLAPIGKGQRGLIVSPPKAGKTTVMKQIAHSIEANNPDVHLIVLLVDERPEEVTDMRRSVRGEVVASTFDRPSDEHTAVAELTIDRAKRLVETGKDVVIILDGITRLARAYNISAPSTGRIMSGGVDSGALYPPKKFFGAARNVEEGGSLTILATALVETGSKMDEVIFEEFKGTGNMELRLDRRLAERRLYPAIDVNASSTRHEELLFDRGQLQQVWKLRRVLNALAADGSAAAGMELLMDKIRSTKSNDEFLAEIAKGPAT